MRQQQEDREEALYTRGTCRLGQHFLTSVYFNDAVSSSVIPVPSPLSHIKEGPEGVSGLTMERHTGTKPFHNSLL